MKRSIYTFVMFLAFIPLANGQIILKEGIFNPEKIKSELAEKYNAYNGRLADQTIELWDTYFLNSPNIGNMHEGRPEIGWEKVHEESIKFVESKPNGDMKMENLEFYPIDSHIAWVKGEMVVSVNNRTFKSNFFDSLVKTVDGWRVILSVVTPERTKEDN